MEHGFILMMYTAWAILMLLGFMTMQAGVARVKNVGSVMMKAFSGFSLAVISFLTAGRYLAFDGAVPEREVLYTAFLAAAAVCVFSGSVMGRMRLISHSVVSVLLGGLFLPAVVRAGGLLSAAYGLADLGGFGLLFTAAGTAAFVGARSLGARLGKYTKGGVARALPGHNIPLSLCGLLLLSASLCVLAGSLAAEAGADEAQLVRVMENGILISGVSGLIALLFTRIRYRKPEITMTASAFLTGAAAAMPGCGSWNMGAACLVGVFAGIFTVLSIENMDRNMNVDDPSGLSAVALVGGVLGLLGNGLFYEGSGLFAGGGFRMLGIEAAAVLAVCLVTALFTGIVMAVLKAAKLLRLPAEQELEGYDLSEYGMMNAYHDFSINIDTTDWSDTYLQEKTSGQKAEVSIRTPYTYPPEVTEERALTKIEIIARREKLEDLKRALNDIGITGMTVFPVTGCGVQRGYNEFYRGVPIEIQLRAKIRMEVVVAKVPVAEVVNTARRVLYTGHVGDGKIFIYSLNDVVRVRTGESGYDAMQGASSE